MKQISLALGLGVALLLFSAAIASNFGGYNMSEMRGAWIAQAFR